MDKNLNCIIADRQKDVFDNLCKHDLDKMLQDKFGEYADIICNTEPTEDGGEIYFSIGIYDLSESIVNFSEELSKELNLSSDDAKIFMEKYIDIFNLNANIDYDEKLNKKDIKIYSEIPEIDEFTEQEDLDIIKYCIENSVDKKITIIIKEFMDNFINSANRNFTYKWQEYTISNPDF